MAFVIIILVGNGRKELELPFAEVLKSEKPNFPFCLCWANESWHSKFWNKDGSIEKKILIEQLYPGDDDIINHFNYVLPAFKDPRYIKVGNSPLFMVYTLLIMQILGILFHCGMSLQNKMVLMAFILFVN